MIDKIYILNEEQHHEKMAFCHQKLADQQFPKNLISVFRARSHNDFEKTAHLCEAAAGEGYKVYQNILDNKSYNECHIGYLAQLWSYLSFMKHVTETKETAVLMHDNAFFNCTYDDLLIACEGIPYKNKLEIAALSTRIEKPILKEWRAKSKFWIRGLRNQVFVDWAMLYTPRGAIKLTAYLGMQDKVPLGWMYHSMQQGYEDNPNTYSLIKNPTDCKIEQPVWKKGEFSTLHDTSTGRPRRPAEETRD